MKINVTMLDFTPVPTDGDGRYLCHRLCADGEPCERTVPLGGIACYQHDGKPLLPFLRFNRSPHLR